MTDHAMLSDAVPTVEDWVKVAHGRQQSGKNPYTKGVTFRGLML
jgi:hypothetical protein